jgi:hypothetical protein
VLSILTVANSDEEAVISLMTLAFSDDPATRWMYPEPRQFLAYYLTFVRLYAGAAFDVGPSRACR